MEEQLASSGSSSFAKAKNWAAANPRISWTVFIVCFICPIYFPINHFTDPSKTVPLNWAIDDATPFIPAAIWVYSLVYLSAAFPLFVVKSRGLFHKIGQAYAIALCMAYVVFLLYPVSSQAHGVPEFRPFIKNMPDTSLTDWAICVNFYFDKPNNCFPSLHIALAYVTAFCCWAADRFYGSISFLVATAIAASTMLVKQHYFADVLAGFILAVFAALLTVQQYQKEEDEELAQPRWVGLLIVPLYLGILGGFLMLWLLDYRPWNS